MTVTARVVGQQRGPKIRIGKYKQRTGYRRHTGFRAALTQIEIESIGGARRGAGRGQAEGAGKAAAGRAGCVEEAAPGGRAAAGPAGGMQT